MQSGSLRLGRDGENRPWLAAVPSPGYHCYVSCKSCGKTILNSRCLENIEHALTDREKTHGRTGKKNRANERLISQWREGARFQVADFSHELVERLPFGFAFLTKEAKPA